MAADSQKAHRDERSAASDKQRLRCLGRISIDPTRNSVSESLPASGQSGEPFADRRDQWYARWCA